MMNTCDISEFYINCRNGDANCYRKRFSYSKRLRGTEVCTGCVYNKKSEPKMIHKRFTIRPYSELDENCEEIEHVLPVEPSDGYDTIQEVLDWCNTNNIAPYAVLITEWNIDDDLDGYGVPDIVASVNLNNVVLDQETEGLTRYSIW
jgi:hypothetical protein